MAHVPLQFDLVGVSGANEYSVKPLALVSTVAPPIVVVFTVAPPALVPAEGGAAADVLGEPAVRPVSCRTPRGKGHACQPWRLPESGYALCASFCGK